MTPRRWTSSWMPSATRWPASWTKSSPCSSSWLPPGRPAPAPAPVAEAPTQQLKPVAARPAAVPDSDFREILEMAQKVKNETIAAAEAKAAAIVAKAEEEAADKLGSLTADKEKLTGQVDALKTAAAEYRAKFESLLQAQQEAMEKASDLF